MYKIFPLDNLEMALIALDHVKVDQAGVATITWIILRTIPARMVVLIRYESG